MVPSWHLASFSLWWDVSNSACSCAEWARGINNGAASSLASCNIQNVLGLQAPVPAPVLSGPLAQTMELLPPLHPASISLCSDYDCPSSTLLLQKRLLQKRQTMQVRCLLDVPSTSESLDHKPGIMQHLQRYIHESIALLYLLDALQQHQAQILVNDDFQPLTAQASHVLD